MSVYQGKNRCPGKDAARGFCYSQLSRRDFLTKQHIVIASRECGDIQYLLRYGVKPRNIIACDVDPIARQAAAAMGVRVSPVESIEDTTDWYLETYGSKRLASINVDLCWTVDRGAPVLNRVLDTLNAFDTRGEVKVFLTYFRSRDARYSNQDRLDALRSYLTNYSEFIQDEWCFHYQSWSLDASGPGSPMTVVSI